MVSGTDPGANLAEAARLIASAADSGAQLVALPEYFCLMGRRDTDKVEIRERPGHGPIQEFLAQQAQRHGVWIVGGTLPLASADPGRVFNSLLLYGPDGQPAGRYDKIHLFAFQRGSESYDESRSICAGSQPCVLDLTLGSQHLRVGIAICYDLRFPELFRAMGRIDLLILPAAFTATTGAAHWEVLLRARAIENLCYVLASAQGGTHDNGRATFGHSMLIDPWGEVLSVLPQGPGVVVGSCDPARLAVCREQLPALSHRVL